MLDLFGPSGVERLKQAGLPSELLADPGAASVGAAADGSADEGRLALLKRLRDRGLLDAAAVPPSPPPVAHAASLSAQIAENLDGTALEREHPAVIAHVLRGQPRPVQLRVLRALPGSVARAVMRFLKL
ncbi:MAG: hypothetical protein COW55_07250 [Rhodobacteraceae bacterium CG17_big_fil_post_rev_8_21_14_2_50_65_11]|nr:MAG: hypothetical protein COW55_07250 [Rhodobacteraceae bacterium CG17_big_fil_post_rev_8_21_14_2_50_65_11]